MTTTNLMKSYKGPRMRGYQGPDENDNEMEKIDECVLLELKCGYTTTYLLSDPSSMQDICT